MNWKSLTAFALVAVLGVSAWWMMDDTRSGEALPGVGEVAAEDEQAAASPASVTADGVPAGPDADVVDASAPVERVEAAAAVGFSGVVVDSAGRPVVGAAVSCGDRNGLPRLVGSWSPSRRSGRADVAETETDSAGSFRLRAPVADGQLRLVVRARGYVRLTREVPRPAGEDVDLGAIELEPGVVLAGRVVDSSGAGVSDAQVQALAGEGEFWSLMYDLEPARGRIAGAGSYAAVTDSNGHFELPHVAAGHSTLSARHEQRPSARLAARQYEAGTVVDDLIVVMRRGASISGRVTRAPSGASLRVGAREEKGGGGVDAVGGFILEGAGMELANRWASVRSDGTFELLGLDPEREYRVWAIKEGGGRGAGACTAPRVAQAGTRGLELAYDVGVTVAFTVVDAVTGLSLTKLAVSSHLVSTSGFEGLFPGMRRSREGYREYADGQVVLRSLRPKKKQKLNLEVGALGYESMGIKNIELPLRGELALGTLRLKPIPVVRVTVRDGASGDPVQGARVELQAVEPPGERRGRSTSGSVSIRIRDTFEDAEGPTHMTFSDGGPDTRRGLTDDQGLCVLNSLPGKTVKIVVKREGYAHYLSDEMSLPTGGAFERSVSLVRGGVVDVLVVDAGNQPVAEVRIHRRSELGGSSSERTDVAGRARFEHLVPGVHRFRLTRNRSVSFEIETVVNGRGGDPKDESWSEVVVADGEEAELVLVKPATAALTGVVRENGSPLARARVSFVEGAGPRGSADVAEAVSGSLGGLMEFAGGMDFSTKTNRDGGYRLEGLPAGEHRLRITHPDRAMPAIVPVLIVGGDQVFDVALETTVLTGRVVGPDGVAVAGARVSVEADGVGGIGNAIVAGVSGVFSSVRPGRGGETTDADGAYELYGVRADVDLVVRAEADDLAPAVSPPVRAQPGQTLGVADLVLIEAGRIAVSVTGQLGPFEMAVASWKGEAVGVAPVMGLLRNGKATLKGLRPGSWSVKVSSSRGEPLIVEVLPGQEAEAQLSR